MTAPTGEPEIIEPAPWPPENRANLPSIADAQLPANYQAAKLALLECSRVDECQDWADKMAAMASYARQSEDGELAKMCRLIQARALERCGELLKQIPAAANRHQVSGDGDDSARSAPVGRMQAARDAGLSERQTVTALRVANVPKEEFERQVESDNPPTVTALAEQGKRPAPTPAAPPPPAVDVSDVSHNGDALEELTDRALAVFLRAMSAVYAREDRLNAVRRLARRLDVWIDKKSIVVRHPAGVGLQHLENLVAEVAELAKHLTEDTRPPAGWRRAVARRFLTAIDISPDQLVDTAPAPEPPIAAATEPAPQPYRHPAGAPAMAKNTHPFPEWLPKGETVVLGPDAPVPPPAASSPEPRDLRQLIEITPERMAEIDREVNGRARAPANRLFALWHTLKPNTAKRCVQWIEEDCPEPFAPLDDVHTIREAAAPFRALAKQCTEAEIDQFVELTKATVH